MWVRVDDRFPRHPKVLKAGELLGSRSDSTSRVITLFVSALCYAGEHLTDGHITQGAIGTMRQQVWNPHRVAEAMADAGLFDRQDDGSYRIHDYHEYNPTASQIKEKRAKDSARKHGGIRTESEGNPERSRAHDPVPSRPVPSRPVEPERTHTAPTALAGTLPRDFRQTAWISKRGKHIPCFLHEEFKLAVGGTTESADQRLRAFYEAVEAGWPEGPIGDDPVKLWRKEFAAKFPSVAPAPALREFSRVTASVLSALKDTP